MHITNTSLTHPIHPQIQVDASSLGLLAIALIDTRAEANTISYDL